MTPSEAYSMDMRIIGDVITAKIRYHEEELDEKMSMLAWQTSHLMTATGNYKKAVKPKDLYMSMADKKADLERLLKEPEDIESLRNELLKTFSDSVAES